MQRPMKISRCVCDDECDSCSEEAIRKAGTSNTTHKSGTDMENHVYVKAKSRVSPAHRHRVWISYC